MTATELKVEKLPSEKPTSEVEDATRGENENDRGHWSSQWDFLLSIVGFAVGLGNVWRFPYLCYRNGGGAFLLPYCLMLLVAGLPLIGLELCIGQYASLGPSALFGSLSPLLSGIGLGMVGICFLCTCYYNLIIAWTIFYTVASFRSVMGWSNCANEYNTINCYTQAEEEACQNSSQGADIFWNRTCYPISSYCSLHNFSVVNNTHCSSDVNSSVVKSYAAIGHRMSASEDYFANYVLGTFNHSWNDYGTLKWDISLCLLAAWIVVALCLIKGVKSSGKVVYFTALFPYFVLLILFVRGVTLDGASDGIAFYITPNISRLADSRVWSDAATQIFFSFGVGFGGLITLASYNQFRNNCIRDTLLLGIINCLTSVFAGSVVFCVIGFMAKRLGKDVSEVVASGPGLIFIAYPEAVVHMPVSPLWAVLFFVMVITLGLDSQFVMVETILTAIYDRWPRTRNRKALVAILSSAIGFLISLSMCTGGGIHLFTLLDWYSSSWSILLLALLEVVIVGWLYGADRMLKLVQMEMGIKMPRLITFYWYLMWKFVTPVILCGILAFSVIRYVPAYYGTGERKYVYPDWANAIGWVIALLPGSMVPIIGVTVYCRLSKHQSVWEMLRETPGWRPARQPSSSEAGTDSPGKARTFAALNEARTHSPSTSLSESRPVDSSKARTNSLSEAGTVPSGDEKSADITASNSAIRETEESTVVTQEPIIAVDNPGYIPDE